VPDPLLDRTAAEPDPGAPPARTPPHSNDAAMWAVLAVVLAGLFVMFRTFVVREVAWAYPDNYDQTKYLWISYSTYEKALTDGLWSGLRELFGTAYSNGVLIHLQALVLMLVFGASRLTVLSVNYVALAVHVVVIAAVVRRITGSRPLALLAAGLAIGNGAFWFRNQADYRLDFSSLCLFGVFVSLVVRSGVFRETRWAVGAGAVAALLVMSRFLTSLYVAGIYGGMLVYFGAVCPWLLKRREPVALRNAGLSALTGAALSVPVVWISRQAIYDYYVVQQGLEKSVRAAEFSVAGVLESWLYYPKSLLAHHVGVPLVLVSLLVLVVSGAARWSRGSRSRAASSLGPPWLTDAFVFLALALVVILGTLTLNITRSPVVGGTAVPLFSWAVLLVTYRLLQPGLARGQRWASRTAAACATVVLAVTVYCQAAFYGSHYDFWVNRGDSREIVRMYGDIGQYADDLGWSRAVVASDSMRDYLLGAAVAAVHYETRGSLVNFAGVLGAGGGVMGYPREAMLSQLPMADFLILTHRRDAGEPPYPMIEALEGIRPAMEEFARSRLVPVGQYAIYGRLVDLYARPALRLVDGVSGGWITDDGLLVEVPRRLASGEADLVISGGMNAWVGSDLTMKCTAGRNGSAQSLDASFEVRDGWYIGRCALPADGGPAPARVRLSFSKFFVPREKGINDDVRRLVIAVPVRAEVVPRPASPAR
jgi:hypothetical protein